MGHADVRSGAAFKTAVRATLILLGVMMVASVTAYFYVQREMMKAIEDQIVEDEVVLRQIYQESGQAGLVEVIGNLRHPLRTKLRVLGLFDSDGGRIAGSDALARPEAGWSRQILPLASDAGGKGDGDWRAETADFYLYATALGPFTLVVGRDLTLIELQERRMMSALAVISVVMSAAFLLLGYGTSLQTLRKLERIGATLERVSEGDTLARLTVTADNDQIDRVARAMNLHLDRLGVLIATTRASAAAIAHDLRTPLSRAFLVLDRAQTALEAGLDPRPAIEGVEAELTRLNSVCDTILRISRLEASKGGGGLGPVALAPLLADLTETFAVLAEERGQILTLAPVPEALEIRGDAAMLSQLMANLLQNATNHCPAGARIGLGVTPLRRGVVLWVVDDGPGIAPEEREKVFAPFYSIDPNRTGGGNGLGLALVKAIADRLGAKIALGDAAPGLRVEVEFPDCRTLEVERDAV